MGSAVTERVEQVPGLSSQCPDGVRQSSQGPGGPASGPQPSLGGYRQTPAGAGGGGEAGEQHLGAGLDTGRPPDPPHHGGHHLGGLL